MVVMMSWTVCTVGADYVLGKWAQSNLNDSTGYFYLICNALMLLAAVVFIVFRVLITFKFSIKASQELHEKMMSRIMGAPVNTYFDKTPIGRLINRLSNDLHSVDIEMPFLIGNTQMTMWRLISCIVVAVGLIYWCIIPLPLVIIASILYLKLYLQLQRKLKRLQKVCLSPILQYTTESYTGAATIRAYENQTKFVGRSYSLLDNAFRCGVHTTALECWVTLRIQFISVAMNILTVFFVVSHFFVCSPTRLVAEERLLEPVDGRTGAGVHAKSAGCDRRTAVVCLRDGDEHGLSRTLLHAHRVSRERDQNDFS